MSNENLKLSSKPSNSCESIISLSGIFSKRLVLPSSVPLIAKKGFLTTQCYYKITNKLQELGQNLSDNRDKFYQYTKSLLTNFQLNRNIDGQIVVYIAIAEVECYQNDLIKTDQALEDAVFLADMSENKEYFQGRCACVFSAIAIKYNRLELAARAIKFGKENLQNVELGEDTGKLLYNEAHQEMKQATMLKRFDHVTRRSIRDKFYESILHYKREPPGHSDNDIRRCLLNMAQTMLAWPTTLKGKYNKNVTKEDIAEAEGYLKIIKQHYSSNRIATERNKQQLMFTESGLHYRKKEYDQAVKLVIESRKMAENSKFKAEVLYCTEFLSFLIPHQKKAAKKFAELSSTRGTSMPGTKLKLWKKVVDNDTESKSELEAEAEVLEAGDKSSKFQTSIAFGESTENIGEIEAKPKNTKIYISHNQQEEILKWYIKHPILWDDTSYAAYGMARTKEREQLYAEYARISGIEGAEGYHIKDSVQINKDVFTYWKKQMQRTLVSPAVSLTDADRRMIERWSFLQEKVGHKDRSDDRVTAFARLDSDCQEINPDPISNIQLRGKEMQKVVFKLSPSKAFGGARQKDKNNSGIIYPTADQNTSIEEKQIALEISDTLFQQQNENVCEIREEDQTKVKEQDITYIREGEKDNNSVNKDLQQDQQHSTECEYPVERYTTTGRMAQLERGIIKVAIERMFYTVLAPEIDKMKSEMRTEMRLMSQKLEQNQQLMLLGGRMLSGQIATTGQRITDQIAKTEEELTIQVADTREQLAEQIFEAEEQLADQMTETGEQLAGKMTETGEQLTEKIAEAEGEIAGRIDEQGRELTRSIALEAGDASNLNIQYTHGALHTHHEVLEQHLRVTPEFLDKVFQTGLIDNEQLRKISNQKAEKGKSKLLLSFIDQTLTEDPSMSIQDFIDVLAYNDASYVTFAHLLNGN